MRKPFERTNNGKYVHELEGINEYADKVARELCSMYPNVDVIDIDYIFMKNFSFAMTMVNLRENAERL